MTQEDFKQLLDKAAGAVQLLLQRITKKTKTHIIIGGAQVYNKLPIIPTLTACG
jgi:hypothetical protein